MAENAVSMVLLPYSDAGLADQAAGTVSLGPDQQALRTLAGLFPADPENSPCTNLLYAEAYTLRQLARGKTAAWRGLLAFVLLFDCWSPEENGPHLQLESYRADSSAWTGDFFCTLPNDLQTTGLHLLTIQRDHETQPLGLLAPSCAIVPTLDPVDLSGLLPARADWFHAETARFTDPVSRLCETDRAILLERLHRLRQVVTHPALAAFEDDLKAVAAQERKLLVSGNETAVEALRIRIAAITALVDEPGSQILPVRSNYELKALQHCLLLEHFGKYSGIDRLQATVTWTVRGVPFAVESPLLGLLPAHHPRENEALTYLRREIALLSSHSLRWNRKLAEGCEHFRNARRGTGMQPEIVHLLKGWREAAEAQQVPEVLHLNHPWSATPVAAASLLREALGASGSDFSDPFSNRLVLMPEGPDPAYGDEALAHYCRPTVNDQPHGSAVLPLSASAAMALNDSFNRGDRLPALLPDGFRFDCGEDGVTVTIVLQGPNRLELSHYYDSDHLITLVPEEVPTISVWPCAAFRRGLWHHYQVYSRCCGPLRVEVLQNGKWLSGMMTSGSQYLQTTEYPACVLLTEQGEAVGAIPNALPYTEAANAGSAVISVNLGTSGTALALTDASGTRPIGGTACMRTILHGTEAAPADETFVSAQALRPLVPSAVLLYGEGSEPFADGHTISAVSASSVAGLPEQQLCTPLSLLGDARTAQATRLHLAQQLTTACLYARLEGAGDVTFRFTYPETLPAEARTPLFNRLNELAVEASLRTGMALTPGQAPSMPIPELYASAACFRSLGVGSDFVYLDVGASSATFALWLRGMDRPAESFTVPLGLQTVLLGRLLRKPEALQADYSDVPEEGLRADAYLVSSRLKALTGIPSLNRSRVLLDTLLDTRGAAMTAHDVRRSAVNGPTLTGALLKVHSAFVLLLTGLLLEQIAQDTLLADRLPAQLELCMAGRGVLPLLRMPPDLQARLSRFLRRPMSPGHPVQACSWHPSPTPGLQPVMGAALYRQPAGDPYRQFRLRQPQSAPQQLIFAFLMDFRSEFPADFAVLFPNVIGTNGLLSGRATQIIRQAAENTSGSSVPMVLTAMFTALMTE